MISLQVLVDDQGAVVAGVRQSEPTSGDGAAPGEMSLLPGPGQTLHTITLPDDSDDVLDSLGTMSVHLDQGEPRLAPTADRP